MTETKWLSQEEQRAWRGFLLASRLVMDQLNRELHESHGLSLTDYAILVRLSEEDDRRLRMTDLAASSGLSKSRLSHQMSRLEARGLTTRAACEDDARGMNAELTEEGFQTLSAASHVHVQGVRTHLLDLLDDQHIAGLGQWTERVVRHLDVEGRSGPLLPAAGF